MHSSVLKVAITQIAPVWLNREATLAKVIDQIETAGKEGAQLIVFGEGLVPGYPFWLGATGAAEFNSAKQKAIFAHYAKQAVSPEGGELAGVCAALEKYKLAAYLGIIECAQNRGGHSLYASLLYIDAGGKIQSVHRKLTPTYEERLVWSPGDGHGLVTHRLGDFTIGGLNCWENWMPLARAALHAQGEDLHVAVWPGNVRNTEGITPFLAQEGRSFVISVSSLMRRSDISDDIPYADEIRSSLSEMPANGGSCIAAPDGSWVLAPEPGPDARDAPLRFAELDHARVREERQNFDPSGHYSRPDVMRLVLNRQRQSVLEIEGEQVE